MCLFIRNNETSATQWVALQDIKCYKVLEHYEGNIYSPYRGFGYKLNKLFSVKIKTAPVRSGIHQFKVNESWNKRVAIGHVERGLHSYSEKKVAYQQLESIFQSNFSSRDCYVYECIIPKGSEFYFDDQKLEYASNKIIIKKIATC